MKNLTIITFALLLLFSCNNSDDPIPENHFAIDNLDNLSIDLSKGVFDNSNGTKELVDDFTKLIFTNENGFDNKSGTYSFKPIGKKIYVNYSIEELKSLSEANARLIDFAPCGAQTTTCYSEGCVKDTLSSIMGDGDRDVDISYRRYWNRVEITYEYQDC